MKKVLVFGGTTEGRKIAETLSDNNIFVHVSVATDYGRQVMEEKENLKILEGRLDAASMQLLHEKNGYDAVIDATHPFATAVSENIKQSFAGTVPLIRFERNVQNGETEESGKFLAAAQTEESSDKTAEESDEKPGQILYADSAEQCRELLLQTQGRILLTTGSKDLNVFCKDDFLKERIVARVLPGLESISLCRENKLEGRQIIAMQGPFSKKMNIAQIEDYGISVLVTKESGKTGGTDTKIQAAVEKGIKCIVIKNPSLHKADSSSDKNCITVNSFDKFYTCLESILGVRINTAADICVNLIGIGMGSAKNMTVEAAEKISNADVIFGAERMLSGINAKAEKYPYYLAKDIVPLLNDFIKSGRSLENVCVLFSGDTGFFSGAAKLSEELRSLGQISMKILPGISAMSYLAAKTGINYQDAVIISLHGTEENVWKPKLSASLAEGRKIFLLTSGVKDVHKVGKQVWECNKSADLHYRMATGFQLSYENENVRIIDPEDCLSFTEEGLYSILLWTE
ncbi:MAG: precorrin-6y C5,15-methyltransferase (decarboxylating) subunit CbiE [Treponemataceae bacterium]|nr:precorrin-6y C5,15-methyltransferase (decarboxylating) subunit CbiE [Treponemataceae bacterium]